MGELKTKTSFWGIGFETDRIHTAAQRVADLGRRHEPMPIRFVNSYSVAAAQTTPDYRRILLSKGMNYADGAPIAACLSVLGWQRGVKSVHRRVRGPSFFTEMLRLTEETELSHLFFGASETTIDQLRAEIKQRFPRLKATGFVSPPLEDEKELFRLAKEAHDELGGDFIWLGLGTPKQDIVAYRLATASSRPCLGVGAAFDFLAGTQRTAPRLMQITGTEWVYRFASEPKRLWKRYTVGNARFVAIACRELLHGMVAQCGLLVRLLTPNKEGSTR